MASIFISGAAAVQASDDFFAIYGIPDHDQRRDGLAGDGSVHCVPTSMWNILDFMRLHGIPKAGKNFFDPGNTLLNSNPYAGHTLRIGQMGAYMNTSLPNGTTGNNGTTGFIDYVDDNCDIPLIVITYSKSENFPSPNAMLPWMRAGGLVAMAYGRYTNPNGFDKDRDGGHSVTLNKVWKFEHDFPNPLDVPWLPQTYNTYRIGYRDPAQDDGDLNAQSTFLTRELDLHAEHANFDGTETTLYGIGDKPASNSSKYAYIDKYRVVLPLTVMTNVVTSDNFVLKLPFNFITDGEKQFYDIRRNANIVLPYNKSGGSFAMDPVAPSFVHTEIRSKKIWQHEYEGRSGRVIATAPSVPTALEYGGPNLDLFVLQADRLNRLTRNNEWRGEAKFDFRPEAVAYDPIANRVVVGGNTTIETLTPELDRLSINNFDELKGDGSVRLALKFDPRSGDLYAFRAGKGEIFKFARGKSGFKLARAIRFGDLKSPTCFDIGPGGHYFFSDGGRLMEFLPNGKPATTSPFFGSEVGETFQLGRSFDNYDSKTMPDSRWYDMEKPLVPRGGTFYPER